MTDPVSSRPGPPGRVEMRHDSPDELGVYIRVPIAFGTESRLDLDALQDPAGHRLVERPMPRRVKDYDAIDSPLEWPERFDLANWSIVSAWHGSERIGGAVIARDSPGVDMLEGRDDLAVVWDLRIAPGWRGQGVGRALFDAAIDWAQGHGCTELRVETQDINFAACRFYSRQGCVPIRIDPEAYDGLDEAMVLWSLPLDDPRVH